MSKFEAVCLCVGLKICEYQPIFCHVCVAWKWQLSNHKLLCNPIDSVYVFAYILIYVPHINNNVNGIGTK